AVLRSGRQPAPDGVDGGLHRLPSWLRGQERQRSTGRFPRHSHELEGHPVATTTRQSQLCWYLSFLVLIALIGGAWAGDIDPSGYERAAGDKFFLIAETPFGSDETAAVRLDGPTNASEEDADILIYRVPDPLAFLKSQRNLHRIQVAAQARPEG